MSVQASIRPEQLGSACPYLPFEAAGLQFHNPCIVGSGPTVKTEGMDPRPIDEAGWGAACLKLSFDPEPYISREPRYRWWKKEQLHSFTAEKRITIEEALRLAEYARKNTRTTKYFANVTYCGDKGVPGWVSMSKRFEAAGIHGIELNMCCPSMSFNKEVTDHHVAQRTGASMCETPGTVAEIVREVRRATGIPLSVKLSPEWGNLAGSGFCASRQERTLSQAWATALAWPHSTWTIPPRGHTTFRTSLPFRAFQGPGSQPLALKDVYAIRSAVVAHGLEEKLGRRCYIVGYGGMKAWKDYVQMTQMGADMIGVCTETMLRGYDYLGRELKHLKEWMEARRG